MSRSSLNCTIRHHHSRPMAEQDRDGGGAGGESSIISRLHRGGWRRLAGSKALPSRGEVALSHSTQEVFAMETLPVSVSPSQCYLQISLAPHCADLVAVPEVNPTKVRPPLKTVALGVPSHHPAFIKVAMCMSRRSGLQQPLPQASGLGSVPGSPGSCLRVTSVF